MAEEIQNVEAGNDVFEVVSVSSHSPASDFPLSVTEYICVPCGLQRFVSHIERHRRFESSKQITPKEGKDILQQQERSSSMREVCPSKSCLSFLCTLCVMPYAGDTDVPRATPVPAQHHSATMTTSATYFNMSGDEDDPDESAPAMNHETIDATRDHEQIFTEDPSLTSTTNASSTLAASSAPHATPDFVPDAVANLNFVPQTYLLLQSIVLLQLLGFFNM